MHERQQRQLIPKQTCARCGSVGFSHTPIADPMTGKTFHLFRCKVCENLQWASEDEAPVF
jgi:hypothetical protein